MNKEISTFVLMYDKCIHTKIIKCQYQGCHLCVVEKHIHTFQNLSPFETKSFRTWISLPFNNTGFRENVFLAFHMARTAADRKQRRSCRLHAAQRKNSAEITPSKPERRQELHFTVT
jgi:hypothetical protein